MNVEDFKRIAEGALTEVLEEERISEKCGWKDWSDESLDTNRVMTELCVTLWEEFPKGSECDSRRICVSNQISEEEVKQEIKRQLKDVLPRYRHYS
jgi:hypothetical protein